MIFKKLATAALMVGITFGAGALGSAHADEQPNYIHALSDLRMARALLSHEAEGNVMRAQAVAIDEIDHAIGEIRQASIDDGRDPNFRPPIDEHFDLHDRLLKARELVEEARDNLEFREENEASKGWRQAAAYHAEQAQNSIDNAIGDKRDDEKHD